jgi:HK97 gp10 family phage protein
MQVVYNVKWLDELLKKFWKIRVENVLNTWIRKAIITTQRKAIQETPVDKWFLRKAYRTDFKNLEWKLENKTSYGIFVHEGTKPHEIKINKKRALSDGKTLFWKRVWHPWTKANPFLTRTTQQVEPQVIKIMNSEILKALKS